MRAPRLGCKPRRALQRRCSGALIDALNQRRHNKGKYPLAENVAQLRLSHTVPTVTRYVEPDERPAPVGEHRGGVWRRRLRVGCDRRGGSHVKHVAEH
jgi:hypothetical protein